MSESSGHNDAEPGNAMAKTSSEESTEKQDARGAAEHDENDNFAKIKGPAFGISSFALQEVPVPSELTETFYRLSGG